MRREVGPKAGPRAKVADGLNYPARSRAVPGQMSLCVHLAQFVRRTRCRLSRQGANAWDIYLDGMVAIVSVRELEALLNALRADYRFGRHDVFPGHIASRGGDQLIQTISEILSRIGEP